MDFIQFDLSEQQTLFIRAQNELSFINHQHLYFMHILIWYVTPYFEKVLQDLQRSLNRWSVVFLQIKAGYH